jgi:HSP20 family protein
MAEQSVSQRQTPDIRLEMGVRRNEMFSMTPGRQQRGHGPLQTRNEDPFNTLRREFESLFDNFFNDRYPMATNAGGGWGLDVEDKGNEYIVHAKAPGFEPGDFDVQVTGDRVHVKAEKKQESKEEGTRYRSFERSFTLPYGTTHDKVEARYRNGVLELHLPKSPEALGRRIEVKS